MSQQTVNQHPSDWRPYLIDVQKPCVDTTQCSRGDDTTSHPELIQPSPSKRVHRAATNSALPYSKHTSLTETLSQNNSIILTDHQYDSLNVTERRDSNRPRLPRISNGPSLASLIAIAKASGFEPDTAPSTPIPPLPAHHLSLPHISEGPSLAALIASADPGDSPYPDLDSDSNSDLEQDTESDFDDIKDLSGHIVRRYEYPHHYAFIVLRERFEARHEGCDGGGARAWARKKNNFRKGESWLRVEIKFDEDGKEIVSIDSDPLLCLRLVERAWSMELT
ncbi:hypothetical protein DE146DRAFT_106374 [Phaeosphaeria sp. MPI-PUGE-AT-0046c]|nr:hypothetical protein DE146DRAFT_106374 [Phaeosphaeria sp. MPI-PUGE-AT-0046c]